MAAWNGEIDGTKLSNHDEVSLEVGFAEEWMPL